MGGRGNKYQPKSKSRKSPPTQPAAQPGGSQQKPDSINGKPMSASNLRQLVANQDAHFQTDPDADIARSLYISKHTDSSGYSMSQNLNFKLEHGGKLDGNEAFIFNNLRSSMQSLGADTKLNRGAHADVVAKLGVTDWSGMSEAQLRKALVGMQWTTNSFTSSSYDQKKNPFFNGPNSGGREVVLNINASKQSRVMLGARDQTEVVMDIGTNFQVTNVRYTGKYATPRGGKRTRQIVLDVDAW